MKWWWASCTQNNILNCLRPYHGDVWERKKLKFGRITIGQTVNVKYTSYVTLAPIGYQIALACYELASIYILYIADGVGVYSKYTATNLNSAHLSPKTVAVRANTHTVIIHINLYIKRPRQGQYFQWVTLLRTFVRTYIIYVYFKHTHRYRNKCSFFPCRDFKTFYIRPKHWFDCHRTILYYIIQ